MAKEDKEQLITLRVKILNVLDILEGEHEWVTSGMVMHVFEHRYGEDHSLSKVGNNLRILRENGVVTDHIKRGLRYWKKTGISYSPDIYVKRLVSFPKSIDDHIKSLSEKAGISKNAFIVNMVSSGVNRLSPLDKAHLQTVLNQEASS